MMDDAIRSRCDNCRETVVDGPTGGYCCSRCGFSVDPPEVAMARRGKVWAERAAFRELIRDELKATRPRKPKHTKVPEPG